MGHVSANNSSANDKFFFAGHGDLPSVQPNSYDHRVSSFMSCNPHQERFSSVLQSRHREDHLRLAGGRDARRVRLVLRHYVQNLSMYAPAPVSPVRPAVDDLIRLRAKQTLLARLPPLASPHRLPPVQSLSGRKESCFRFVESPNRIYKQITG